jgi:hypothetical protein
VSEESRMTGETRRPPKYRVGDKIRVEIEASDESGVAEVEVDFTLDSDTARHLILSGDGGGQTDARIVLEKEVTDDIPPGEYTLFYITLTDTRGNTRVVSDEVIKLRIETDPKQDYDAPDLKSLRVI